MVKEPHPDMVIIIADKYSDKTEGGLIVPDLVRENQNKKQNRGEVSLIGSKVEWPAKGDYVSFYRNAATPIIEDGTEYLVINAQHILATLSKNVHVEA